MRKLPTFDYELAWKSVRWPSDYSERNCDSYEKIGLAREQYIAAKLQYRHKQIFGLAPARGSKRTPPTESREVELMDGAKQDLIFEIGLDRAERDIEAMDVGVDVAVNHVMAIENRRCFIRSIVMGSVLGVGMAASAAYKRICDHEIEEKGARK